MNVGKFLLLHEKDNVLVCCQYATAGEAINVDGNIVRLLANVDVGHKIAKVELRPGDKIIKYGVSIGSSTDTITSGEHVHLQNMKSDYIVPHSRNN